MPVTDADARALTYLARRLRTETYGANDWDEAGVWTIVSGLIGQQLATSIERVARHAADPTAKTPGAINRPFIPAAPGPQAPRNPEAHKRCSICGKGREHVFHINDHEFERLGPRTAPPANLRDTAANERNEA